MSALRDRGRSSGSLPAIFTFTGGALAQTCFVLEGIEVHAERMRANLDATRGLIVSEAVMMGARAEDGSG